MLISSENIEIPDECPEKCPGKLFPVDMQSICFRCPILNCKSFPGPDGQPFCMCEPEGYRPDWAKVWRDWFKTDMKEYPELYFKEKNNASV